jgi:hypothetical protein
MEIALKIFQKNFYGRVYGSYYLKHFKIKNILIIRELNRKK